MRTTLAEQGDPRLALGVARGWGRNDGMFRDWPENIAWSRVAMTPDELLDVLFIDWDWWLTVTGGTRRPRDARVDAAGYEPIALAARTNPELIAVRAAEGARIVLVEGHVRLTAYALFPQHLPSELELYLGESPEIVRWGNY